MMRSLGLLVVLLTLGCEAIPCGSMACPSGYDCVQVTPEFEDYFCARRCVAPGACSDAPGCTVEAGPQRGVHLAIRVGTNGAELYCPFGTLEEGEACDVNIECLLPLDCVDGVCVAACQDVIDETFTVVSAACPDGTGCWSRRSCLPRCDLPGGSCPSGMVCNLGSCTAVTCDPPCAIGEACVEGATCEPVVDCDADGLPDCPTSMECADGFCRAPT